MRGRKDTWSNWIANVHHCIAGWFVANLLFLVGLGRISGKAGYPAIFNIRPDTGY